MFFAYWNHFVGLSVHLSCLCFHFCLDDISCRAKPFLFKLGMVVYDHEVQCRAEKLVHHLQCQGHSEGLYDKNMTFYYVLLTASLFAAKLCLIALHHTPECPVEKEKD